MDQQIQVPIDHPEADTEWNDILRSKGIIPPKPPSPTPLIEAALLESRTLAHANRLEHKTLTELSDLEDDELADDGAFLESYRRRRLDEFQALSRRGVHGQVYPVQKVDYASAITDASKSTTVLLSLLSSSFVSASDSSRSGPATESRVLSSVWRELAERYQDVKFCEIKGDMCIESYPETNCPTVLIYQDGEIKRQIVTLREVGGVRSRMADWETVLVDVGAIEENDARLMEAKNRRKREEEEDGNGMEDGRGESRLFGQRGKTRRKDEDSDDDWD